jgi:hypothetical protein
MAYHNTQRGMILFVLAPVAATAVLFGPLLVPGGEGWVVAGIGLLLGLVTALFATLTVRDEGEALVVHYGPLPLVRKRIRYEDVRGFRAARSDLLAGWGIHWVPGRGWIWNAMGRECVELELPRGRFRVGTNDVAGLTAFLARRVPGRAR